MEAVAYTPECERINGSHRAEIVGDKVRIYDLELFVGFDPDIDTSDDADMAEYTAERVAEIIARTRKFMDRNQNPRFVIAHEEDGKTVLDESVGEILSIREGDINGAPGIYGDVEMSASDFDRLIRSNRYPRRSAEIWPDGYMSEVALLGRDTPRRPLPDTRFKRDGQAQHFARATPEVHFDKVGPGSGNVTVPNLPQNKEKTPMADKEEKTDYKALYEKAAEQIEKLKAELDKMKAAKNEKPDEDDKDKNAAEVEEKVKNARKAAADEVRNEFSRKLDTLQTQLDAERTERRKVEFSRTVDGLKNDGFAIDDAAAIVQRLVDAKDPEAEVAFIKANFRRDPLNVRVNTSGTITGKQTFSREDMSKIIAEAEKHANGDVSKYRAYMDEHTK